MDTIKPLPSGQLQLRLSYFITRSALALHICCEGSCRLSILNQARRQMVKEVVLRQVLRNPFAFLQLAGVHIMLSGSRQHTNDLGTHGQQFFITLDQAIQVTNQRFVGTARQSPGFEVSPPMVSASKPPTMGLPVVNVTFGVLIKPQPLQVIPYGLATITLAD